MSSASLGGAACENTETPAVEVDAAVPARPPRERPKPTRVADRAGALSVGNTHACVVTERDRLICWGDDRYGHLLDGAQGRVTEVAAGSVGHVALMRDGDLQGAPDFEGDLHEAPFRGRPVLAQPAPRGVRISYGQGRDAQGCLIDAEGKLECQFYPRSYFQTFANRWRLLWRADHEPLHRHRWTGITPHANVVGCGWRSEGGPACWTLGFVDPEEPLHWPDPMTPATAHETYFEYRRGAFYNMPESAEHLCASPYMACMSQAGQWIQCWRVGFGTATVNPGQWSEHEVSTHILAPDPFLDEAAGGITAMACGATSGPLLGPPPHRAAVCVAEAAGVRCQVAGDELQAEPTWTVQFEGEQMRQLDTNGLVVCGVNLEGKVRCEALTGALPTHTAPGLATLNGLLNVPPALRP